MPRGRKPGNKNKPKVQTVTDSMMDSINNDIEFESEEKNKDTRADVTETCITHISGEDYCLFYSRERWGKNFIKEILKEHPDEVEVRIREDDGTVTEITLPYKCMRYIRWPSKREQTEEQKEALRERMRKARERRKDN